MYLLLHTGIDLLSPAIALIPALLLLNHFQFRNLRLTGLYLLLSLYLSALWLVTGLPTFLCRTFEPTFYLLPVIGMADDVRNSILNCVLFLPLGFLLPLIWTKYRKCGVTVLFGFFLSLAVELMQIFSYRLTDVNDLITNTAGTALGFLLARPLLSKTRGHPVSHAFPIVAVTACVMFFVQPLVSGLLWKLIP